MIGTLLKISFINLRRDRVVQAMAFLLPVMFFSIFALVFGQQKDPTHRVNVLVVDEDHSEYSQQLVKALSNEGGLSVRTTAAKDVAGPPLTGSEAEQLVHDGKVPVAVVLPKGLGATPRIFAGGSDGPKVKILSDVSDPIAPQMVLGLLQKVSFTAAPEQMADQGIDMFSKYAGALTPAQQQAVANWKSELHNRAASGTPGVGQSIGLPTEIVNVMQKNNSNTDTISFYAAGVGVMFLLFSCSGAGGALLEEEEAGTLGRLVGSRLGMTGVLAGKWLYLVCLGVMQLTLMFVWGAVVFGVPLKSHIPGFVVMTLATASAAAGFGMVLATIARSRQQLSGISTILILAMSAIGGSMFPRFLMSETMQKMGLITFNAWALDGYINVFWRDAPIIALWPQLLVLTSLTVVFMTLARFFARRWEAF